MRYMEIDFVPQEVNVWIKDDQLEKAWVKTYYVYPNGNYSHWTQVLELALEQAEKYGVTFIRVLERVGGNAYEYMESHTARRGSRLLIQRYIYSDLQYTTI